ncbi:peptidylprolyl isomerase [candidate division KSB1 bacterium]|nr:peptidylprolyl isomerase [candidate division KSB1 bacterium]
MKKIIRYCLVPAMLVVLSGCGSKEPVVATVGGEKIREGEFKTAMVERFKGEQNAAKRPYADREKFLHEYALGIAKYLEGESRGIAQRPEVQEDVEKFAKQKSLELLYQKEIMDKVVNDQIAREFYDKSAQEVHGRHILLKVAPVDSSATDSVRAKQRIDSIATAIKQGLSFKAAAKLFSDDGTTAADSGDLGWFQWGRMVEEFQTVAWAAKLGEPTAPFRTQYGYHLLLIEERRPVADRRPFDEMKETIKNQLREIEGQKLNDTAREYVAQLREKSGLKLEQANLELFRKRLADPSVPKSQALDPVFTAEQKQLAAATFKGGSATLGDLIGKVGTNAFRVNWEDPKSTEDIVASIVEPKLLEAECERQGLLKEAKQDPVVKQQIKSAVIRLLEKEEITDKVNPTDEDVRRFYDSHLENFIQPEQRTVREIFIKNDSTKAARIRERALKGENFAKLAKQFNEKESTQPDTGRIGPFEEKRFGAIGKTAFGLAQPGDVSELVKAGKNFSVIQLLSVQPSRTKVFEESKADAGRQCRQAMTDAAAKALEEAVLSKHPLKPDSLKLAAVWPLEKGPEKIAREP